MSQWLETVTFLAHMIYLSPLFPLNSQIESQIGMEIQKKIDVQNPNKKE